MAHRYDNVDLSGQQFHKLTAVKKVDGTRSQWLCKCQCGNEKIYLAYKLINGEVKSCGCLEQENLERIAHKTKHGMTNTILYKKWCGMKARCYNPNYEFFYRYGGRGIKVCDEWLGEHGFENFMKWAYEAGYDDTKKRHAQSIDRIDMDKDYEPSNCKWSDQVEQSNNRRTSVYVLDVDGERLTHAQFMKKHGIDKPYYLRRRLSKGLTIREILDEWELYSSCSNGDYYTINEAAEHYNVCKETILNWIYGGLLDNKKVCNKWYILKGQERPIFEDRKPDGTFKKTS